MLSVSCSDYSLAVISHMSPEFRIRCTPDGVVVQRYNSAEVVSEGRYSNIDEALGGLRTALQGIADRRYTEIVDAPLKEGAALVVEDLKAAETKKPTQGMQMRM